MTVLMINHHLFQEGDTYGLIYALALSKTMNYVGGIRYTAVYGLFYVDAESYGSDEAYRKKILRRLGYFSSFGLLDKIKIAACSFADVQAFEIAAGTFKISETQEVDCVRITANKTEFKSNPRLVSYALTRGENSTGVGSIEFDTIAASRLNTTLRGLVENDTGTLPTQVKIQYDYIDRSTNYIEKCLKQHGFLAVSRVLRQLILNSSTEGYTSTCDQESTQFLDEFIQTLLQTYQKKSQDREHYGWTQSVFGKSQVNSQDFVIVLFWIRAAKQDEFNAIFYKEGGGSVGKPQHHTNLSLYKHVRALVQVIGEKIGKPLLFVPIGDELKEIVDEEKKFQKAGKTYNLINFFQKSPFKDNPMGAQIKFLLRLATQYQVIQVGMRSGSMERLMYLGVPTIYFDRTEDKKASLPTTEAVSYMSKKDKKELQELAERPETSIVSLPPTVGASRIKQLCGFQGKGRFELVDYLVEFKTILDRHESNRRLKEANEGATLARGRPFQGYPLFFHVENFDTGVLGYSWFKQTTQQTQDGEVTVPGSRVEKSLNRLFAVLNANISESSQVSQQQYKEFKQNLLQKGYLRDNLKASKTVLAFGSLQEEERYKLTYMLWFISVIYPGYQALQGGTAVPDFDLKENAYFKTLSQKRLKKEQKSL